MSKEEKNTFTRENLLNNGSDLLILLRLKEIRKNITFFTELIQFITILAI